MVGAFQNLPMVMPSDDILSSAKRKARRVAPSKGMGQYRVLFNFNSLETPILISGF